MQVLFFILSVEECEIKASTETIAYQLPPIKWYINNNYFARKMMSNYREEDILYIMMYDEMTAHVVQ